MNHNHESEANVSDIQWNDPATTPPPKDRLIRVLYADGVECNAKWAGGAIYYPEGSSMYRYVNVIKWREITEGESK